MKQMKNAGQVSSVSMKATPKKRSNLGYIVNVESRRTTNSNAQKGEGI
jgi:hypothetical protein